MAMQPESEVKFEDGRHHEAGGTKSRSSRLAVARLTRKTWESMRIWFEKNILSRYVFRLLLNNEVAGERNRKEGKERKEEKIAPQLSRSAPYRYPVIGSS